MSESIYGHGWAREEFTVPGWVDYDTAPCDVPTALDEGMDRWRFDPYHLILEHRRRWWGGKYTLVVFEAEQYHQDKLDFMRAMGLIE